MRKKDEAFKIAEGQRKKDMQRRNIEQLKVKFEEFTHCHVNDVTLQTYNKYFEDKLKARHVQKP